MNAKRWDRLVRWLTSPLQPEDPATLELLILGVGPLAARGTAGSVVALAALIRMRSDGYGH